MTKFVIKAVEKMAEEQGVKYLKISRCNKQLLHPTVWIAVVDCDNSNENEAENEEENDEDYVDDGWLVNLLQC
jgi:hypothetical protein